MHVRTLLRRKRSWLPAAGILALGIGMSVAIFSLADAVLLRPLPFARQESIQVIWKTDPLAGSHVEELAYPELADLQRRIRDFEYVAVMPTSLYGYARILRMANAEPVQIESAPVSHDFFRVLGVSPVLGRNFAAEDERPGAAPVVVVSWQVWRDRLGSDPAMIGRTIDLNGEGRTVIGVMGQGVEFPRGAGLWVPLGVEDRIVERRGATFLQAIARPRPGVGRDRIAAEVDALFRAVAAEHPEFYTPSQRAVVTPLTEYWTGSARQHLWIMLAASLLLLAASIVAAGNLLLSGTLARRVEIATRMALGAGRGRILAQLTGESAIIAGVAAAIGLGVARAAIWFLVRLAPPDIPRLTQASVGLDSFCFAACAATLAAFACALIPGWSVTRLNLESALREGGARLSLSRRAGRAGSFFILAQTALTVVLLAAASLLVLSYRAMLSADSGFANRDAVSMNLQLRGPGVFSAADPDSRRAFYTRLLDKLRASPGVISAAAVLLRPLEGTIGWDVPYQFEFEAGARDSRVLPKVNFEAVTPGYFRTVGTPLVEGRDFNGHDTADAEPVAIVSRPLAQKIRAAGFSPVGYRIRVGGASASLRRIVGVSAAARYRSVAQTGSDIFVPCLQAPQPTNYLVLRGTPSPAELSALVRRTLAELDPGQAVAGVATIGELIDANAARHRFNAIVLLWFSLCAAVLAAAGVYSVVAQSMTARASEIAIRIALGAQRPRLVRDMITHTLLVVCGGEFLGIWAVAALGDSASTVLYGVSARDPLVFGSVAASIFAVSLASAAWPAWSASRWNPKVR